MSENVKHTPGPWEACERGDYSDDGIVILGEDMRVAVVNREEDAALIEAAPDLLKAVIDCLKELDRSQRPSYAWQLRAKAAIAKAEARP